MNHPARENHRIIPLTINDSAWNLQYSPYVYYNEHCIVFNNQHTPMKIERATFRKLLDFVGLFPPLFRGQQRRPAHRGRQHSQPRPFPGRPL